LAPFGSALGECHWGNAKAFSLKGFGEMQMLFGKQN